MANTLHRISSPSIKMRGHYTPKARASIPHQYLPAGNIPQKCILKAYKKGRPKKKDIRLATEEWKVLTPHGGYELLAEIHQVLKDGLWLLWPSDTIHMPLWAHWVNAEQWKRNAMWFSQGWDRRSLSSKRGSRRWVCFARASAASKHYHLERQRDALTPEQSEANGRYRHCFQRAALENKQVNTQRSSPLTWACTKPFENI